MVELMPHKVAFIGVRVVLEAARVSCSVAQLNYATVYQIPDHEQRLPVQVLVPVSGVHFADRHARAAPLNVDIAPDGVETDALTLVHRQHSHERDTGARPGGCEHC